MTIMTDNPEPVFIKQARHVKSDEVLILQSNRTLSQEVAEQIKAQIEAKIGTAIPLLVVSSDWDITVLKPPTSPDDDSSSVGFA